MKIKKEKKNIFNVDTVCFNKPYRNPVYKCTGSRQGFTKLAIYNAFIHYSVNISFLERRSLDNCQKKGI